MCGLVHSTLLMTPLASITLLMSYSTSKEWWATSGAVLQMRTTAERMLRCLVMYEASESEIGCRRLRRGLLEAVALVLVDVLHPAGDAVLVVFGADEFHQFLPGGKGARGELELHRPGECS